MNDKEVLKYLLGLGLETLIARSGQEVADFITGSNVPEAPRTEPKAPVVEDTSFDNAEHERRFNK